MVVLLSPAGLVVGACSGPTDPPRANKTHLGGGEKKLQNKRKGKGKWKNDEDSKINPARHAGI